MVAITKIVFVGFGAIAKATVPILCENWPNKIRYIAFDHRSTTPDDLRFIKYGVDLISEAITPDTYVQLLTPHLGASTFLVNLSTGVSSDALLELCQRSGTLYIDTCVEPWEGGYIDKSHTEKNVTNYALRKEILLRKKTASSVSTAIIAHGANPGLISHFVKDALLFLARHEDVLSTDIPEGQAEWAALARQLGVAVIQIAERDTQVVKVPFPENVFVNTWSVHGMISELEQAAEFGWGTHEEDLSDTAARHHPQCSVGYLIGKKGFGRVKSWNPTGTCDALLITHHESIALAEYFTCDAGPCYRPTVYYAYRPCDATMASIKNWTDKNEGTLPKRTHVCDERDLAGGADWLGVLLIRTSSKSLWFGSSLSLEEAQLLAPFNTATTLQVAAGIYGAMRWALEYPNAGIVEAEDLHHIEVMKNARKFLGKIDGYFTSWPHAEDPAGVDHTPVTHNPTNLQLKNFLL